MFKKNLEIPREASGETKQGLKGSVQLDKNERLLKMSEELVEKGVENLEWQIIVKVVRIHEG